MSDPQPAAPAAATPGQAATPVEALAAELERQGHDTSGVVILGLPSAQRNGIIMFRAQAYDGAAKLIRDRLAPAWDALAAQLAEAREVARKALAANERWAATLGDMQQAARERDEARAVVAEMIAAFSPTIAVGDNRDMTALTGRAQLARWHKRAGLEPS